MDPSLRVTYTRPTFLMTIHAILCHTSSLNLTSSDEIHETLNNLKDGSIGCNNNDAMFAKYVSSVISNCMAHVINLSMSSGIVTTN